MVISYKSILILTIILGIVCMGEDGGGCRQSSLPQNKQPAGSIITTTNFAGSCLDASYFTDTVENEPLTTTISLTNSAGEQVTSFSQSEPIIFVITVTNISNQLQQLWTTGCTLPAVVGISDNKGNPITCTVYVDICCSVNNMGIMTSGNFFSISVGGSFTTETAYQISDPQLNIYEPPLPKGIYYVQGFFLGIGYERNGVAVPICQANTDWVNKAIFAPPTRWVQFMMK
ncbi:MAG: hypothetical protein M1381_09300 [Deltaproteobacteria bacterium]|nr:hypothetical protein [Deltaproteobacteria bacterium]